MLRLTVAAAAAALSLAAQAAPESFTLDPAHTYPNFTVSHQGFSTMYGQFTATAGKLVIDRVARTLAADVVVEAKSVYTGHAKRDEYLRSADFFNAAEYPRIIFKSTGSKWDGDSPVALDGNLTLLGKTRPVTLAISAFHCALDQRKAYRCGADATTTIKRSEFGMTFGIPAAGDEIRLMFEIEATRD